MDDVQIQEYRPIPALRPYVQRFWTGRFNVLRTEGFAQRVAPNGFVEVIIHLTDLHCAMPGATGWRQTSDYILIGVQSESYEVRFSCEVEVFGIRFKPAGFFSLFGIPLNEMVDTHEDLVAILGARFREIADRIREASDVAGMLQATERYLGRVAAHRETSYLNHATELIRTSGGSLRVADLADHLNISRRQLERDFKDKVGLSPKYFMRIARLNYAQGLLQDGNHHGLADVAYQAGYADQAHFSREFKRLVGERPTHFLTEPEAYSVHAVEDVPDR